MDATHTQTALEMLECLTKALAKFLGLEELKPQQSKNKQTTPPRNLRDLF